VRFINLEQLRPAVDALIPDLRQAAEEVLNEQDPARRAALIEKYRSRWVAFRAPFDAFSYGKCWYVECKNPGTDDDIDHFRPKGGIYEDDDHPGYYWLAFEWTNLRLSCHRANRLRINPDTAETGGKADHFPLVNPADRARRPEDDWRREIPALFDPTDPRDPAMLSFKPNGEVDLSPEFKGNAIAEIKFDASRIYLHLNWPKFRDDRVILYNNIVRLIERGVREAPESNDGIFSASNAFLDAVRDLVNVIRPQEAYSAAARVYVESFKHDIWWVRDIVLKVAA
jgi:hypothetical protein